MSNRPTTTKNEHFALTGKGARRAMNYLLDLAKGRKTAVTFIFDETTGNIKEVSNSFTKEIEVEKRVRN